MYRPAARAVHPVLLRRAERELDRLSERVEQEWHPRDPDRARRVSQELGAARDILRRVLAESRALS